MNICDVVSEPVLTHDMQIKGSKRIISYFLITDPEEMQEPRRRMNHVLYPDNPGKYFTQDKDVEQHAAYVVAYDGSDMVGAGRLTLRTEEGFIKKSGLENALHTNGHEPIPVDRETVAGMRGAYVEKEYRRHGIGDRLRQCREALAVSMGSQLSLSLIRDTSTSIYMEGNYAPTGVVDAQNRAYVFKILT